METGDVPEQLTTALRTVDLSRLCSRALIVLTVLLNKQTEAPVTS